MPELWPYDYAVIRVVPRVERGEFINAGIIISSAPRRFLAARVELDEGRLKALDAHADVFTLRQALDAICLVCAGGPAAGALAALSLRERFHWLVAPRSTCIQMSPVHTGRCSDMEAALESLLRQVVRPLTTPVRPMPSLDVADLAPEVGSPVQRHKPSPSAPEGRR